VGTTKAEDIEVKIWENIDGKVKLNQNILCTYRLSKGWSSCIFGTAYRMKLKLPGHHDGDVQLTKRQHVYTKTAISTTATAVTTTTITTLLLLLLVPNPTNSTYCYDSSPY
jgi:hypothetical protein